MFTSIQIKKEIHIRLKIVSAISGKKLYELISECLEFLEAKYLGASNE